ncbi:MAG: 3-hydroxyacyl-CoA dehydrogenase NAD-binding domain-containing protein [Chitinophagales bacterium]
MIDTIQKIAIIGAGTMGAGIAQLAAMAGYKTILFDINEDALVKGIQTIAKNMDGAIKRGKMSIEAKEATLQNLHTSTNFQDLKADFILEAIVEKLEVKVKVFQDLAAINSPQTIFASNTSSIPITRIAAQIPHPERVVGMHFFNPPHIMKLVEVILGAATQPDIAETVKALAEKMGKKAVIAKDAPGFIVNRVARSFYLESLKILEEQVADIETIDALLESSGFRMGPFKLMDLIGIDVNHAVSESMYASFYNEPRFRPSRIQRQKVEAGHHGKKSGKGFYD